MKSVALITEYNPFHNGHLYHAQKSKSITGADISVAIMSGHFVMRGQPAIYNKFIRTQMALSAVDLVIELPAYATLSAGPYFAEAAVKVADYLSIDHLSFGSESGNIDAFTSLAKDIESVENSQQFIIKSKEGKSYPRILSELVSDNTLLSSPNNTLGISYVRAIRKWAPTIQPWTLKREQSSHHDAVITGLNFASGTSIRKSIKDGEELWKHVVPQQLHDLYDHPAVELEDTFHFIKYAILSNNLKSLNQIYTMSEGLEHRLKQVITQATSFEHLMALLKTKRYTYTHLQRVLMNILLNFKQNHAPTNINAARVLGMNQKGQQYLKELKKNYPERHFITQVNKKNAHFFSDEIHATKIYNLLSQDTATDFNTPVIRI
ncbi:nucleotidyltransferase [Staphylococcus succinus]|uniref:nucleotidyltransferase n=1 Tax=Staphylococcus succinus TaxID=61015 RepID=UPI000D1EB382|nr:nucleotidyltransferase [Staphylococcus succinus]PTI48325.1 nucleotidyltransferase [Staphylococcus succinus]